MRLLVDGELVDAREGESLLVALLRAGLHPTGGGCLCLAGDCPNCLATVDGISYTRTCEVAVAAGRRIERHHLDGGQPPLSRHRRSAGKAARITTRHLHCDVAVLGHGRSGRREAARARDAGREVVTLDLADGQEVVGIYAGPLVVARTAEGTLQVHPRREVVVATGAAELHAVVPGNELPGLVTARAASELARADLDLGRVVAVGSPPEDISCDVAEGELVRFEGSDRLEAVVVRDDAGSESRLACDTASLGLGMQPRDALFRMARDLPGVRVVGAAARASDLPPCPRAGTLCSCSGVEVADLETVWEHGFRELELVKRATLAGTGTCQGSVCLPHLRSFLLDRGRELQPPFTARPVTRQPTIGEIASGAWHPPTPTTPLHGEHLRLGATMERSGGWWRPWTYGDPEAEYRAMREGVSIGDVSTLGKFVVSGTDAEAFLDYLYPTRVSTLKPGRSRYVLLLDERGYVLDDGLLSRDDETRFTLSLTSAGSTFGELWIRDWAEGRGADVRILNQTMSLAAINVTGPRAAELLARAGLLEPPRFVRHARAEVAGIACHVFRLSFTGELSYELHHAAADAVVLWRRLLELGRDLGVRPHGLATLLDLRLEKGHIVVGQDTDFDSTPRRLDHEWAARLDKEDFLGLPALRRTNRIALDKRLVGLETDPPAPIEGDVVLHHGEHVGYVTSSTESRVLGRAVMLAWVDLVDGEVPDEVTVGARTARRVPTPFYDPRGERARGRVEPLEAASGAPASWEPVPSLPSAPPEADRAAPGAPRFRTVEATRIVARAGALDAAAWPEGATVLRVADDEALVLGSGAGRETVDDPFAIVERETGFSAAWLPATEAAGILSRTCSWRLPERRPAFAQGAVAEVPLKLWLEQDRVLFVVATPYLDELEERL